MPDEALVLQSDNLVCGYNANTVIDRVSLGVRAAEVVAVIGHNGAGKSTLLRALFGLVSIRMGLVLLDQRRVVPSPREMLRAGVRYVPQGGRVFDDLTVAEHLEIAQGTLAKTKSEQLDIVNTFALFPELASLRHHRAGTLSGGEKQMVALSMALSTSPRVLLLDEPLSGLSPSLVTATLNCVRRLVIDHGISMIIVEHKVRRILEISDRAFVLRRGEVSFSGPARDLEDEALLRNVYL